MEITALVGAILDLDPTDLADDRPLSSYDTWTSMKHVQIVVALESAYGVSPSVQEIKEMKTIADIRRVYVKERTP
ncbi:acyl carrier protein [Kutzneria sp. CA-103260]|uniref:acyl carrier protein n=1 Tax=Kutzneria sp. CA-103260 TaxID=2802641 RepID=UPI001BA78FD7|nr:acyl carrier protein [Kutzneria sp. CA-103260]QUQ67037.1 Phosphopantetheine attachment site [Kutzneria sp. CA-103260]